MPRYFIELAYDGTDFHGWQFQINAISVQQTIDDCLQILLKHPIESTGCGRTDSGVHASQFYMHFNSDHLIEDNNKFIYSLNAILPGSIAIYNLILVAADAHARFDAKYRSYGYYISLNKHPFLNKASYFHPQKLDVGIMNQAAEMLKQHDNFACFMKNRSQSKGSICNIQHAVWREYESILKFEITANRFLRGMVRAIVGTMLNIGEKRKSLDDFKEVLESNDRKYAGHSAQPQALFLEEINYSYIQSVKRTPFSL